MRFVVALAAIAIVLPLAAWAKEFPPGDLRICGAKHCRILTPAQSNAFSAVLWGDSQVVRAPTPRVGSAVLQLRYPNGPAGAIITPRSIRVAGLNCGRFERGKWYRLPKNLRGLTDGLEPRRLSAFVPRSC